MKGTKFKFKVDVTDSRTGGITTVDYVTGWGPQKVSLELVAQSCAAELTVEKKVQYLPVKAILVGEAN